MHSAAAYTPSQSNEKVKCAEEIIQAALLYAQRQPCLITFIYDNNIDNLYVNWTSKYMTYSSGSLVCLYLMVLTVRNNCN